MKKSIIGVVCIVALCCVGCTKSYEKNHYLGSIPALLEERDGKIKKVNEKMDQEDDFQKYKDLREKRRLLHVEYNEKISKEAASLAGTEIPYEIEDGLWYKIVSPVTLTGNVKPTDWTPMEATMEIECVKKHQHTWGMNDFCYCVQDPFMSFHIGACSTQEVEDIRVGERRKVTFDFPIYNGLNCKNFQQLYFCSEKQYDTWINDIYNGRFPVREGKEDLVKDLVPSK